MTFLTLVLVVTQTVSVGVVDKPMVLANGTRLMPGDRVLAIHDTAQPWLTFLPSGEFLPLDSSKVVISDGWHAPDVKLSDHPEAESGLWSEPDRRSQRVPWPADDLRGYFSPYMPTAFCYRDSSFWASLRAGEATGWFSLTRKEVLGSISGFGPSTDSSRARALFDLADAMRLGRTRRPDSVRYQTTARLYELSLEASRRRGDREMAASALLTLATIDTEHKADSVALARCKSAAREFVGVKSIYGRTDAYAYWQMMELAWRHKEIARTDSLARRTIIAYPTEAGSERVITRVGESGTSTYGMRSVWFDVEAAERLLEAAVGGDSQVIAAAEFLTQSASAAVRFRGYEKLIALSQKRSDTASALSYARTALSLPHYWQWEVWPPSGCTNQGGRRKHDFKDEFMDSLDVLLPFSDLLGMYDNAYDAKDTMMSRDAANWFIRQIEQGRTPPRAGILERIGPPTSAAELKRALLVSITTAPQFRTAVECTLFAHRPDDYPNRGRMFTQALPSGSFVRPNVFREGLIRVATPSGLSGWTNARSLRGALSVWDIPAVEMAEPVASADFNGDGVRDLRLSTTDLFDGKGLATVRPPDRKNSWLRQIGVFRRKWVELRGDTLWLQGVGADTIATGVPVARKAKKGVCKPGSCFYFVAMPGPNDSFAWVSAVRERGTVWTSPVSIRKDYPVGVCQIDSALVVLQEKEMWLLSATNGALRGQVATPIYLKSWRGVFLNRSGYAVAKGDSVVFHDYSGSKTIGVAVGKSDAKFFPPFTASFESDVWGVGNFGQPLCPIASEAIPVVTFVHRYDGERWRYDITMHLISLTDGRELAAVPISENSPDCRYDEQGIYVSDDTSFRAITWEGKPLAVADLPYLSYPIWNGDRAVSYYSKPMGLMLSAEAASGLAASLTAARRGGGTHE